MKRITNLFAALCLCCCVSSAYATDYYISATGNDANNGYAKESPVATLNKIHQLLQEDLTPSPHRIFVEGVIDISKEPTSPLNTDDAIGFNGTKNGGLEGFFFKGAKNWGEVSFYGLRPLVQVPLFGSNMGKVYLEPTDGFDAKGLSRIFAIDGGTHEFVNLLFKGGSDLCDDGGGAMWIRGTNTKFKNCLFTKNYGPLIKVTVNGLEVDALATGGSAPTGGKTNGCGGALALLTGNHEFEDCVFDDNMNRQGAAIWASGGSLTIKNSIFMNHDGSKCKHMTSGASDSHGGAIQLQNNHADTLRVYIESTLFVNNSAYGQGGAIRQSPNANKDGKVNPFLYLTIKDCVFNNNYSGQQAGALIVHNESLKTLNKVTVLNSQFYDNMAAADGGAICLWSAQPGDEFTMVNSSVIYNATQGNEGHGPGLVNVIHTTHLRSNRTKYFYNNIFDGNTALHSGTNDDGIEKLGNDFVVREENNGALFPLMPGELIMEGNLIGRVQGPSLTLAEYPENEFPTYVGNLVADYMNWPGYILDPEARTKDKLPWPDENLKPTNMLAAFYPEWFYVVPLEDNAYARTFGKAEYLTTYGITKDVLGFDRVINGTTCTVGAVEASAAGDLFDPSTGAGIDIATWAWPLTTLGGGDDGIAPSKVAPKDVLVIKGGALEFANGANAKIEIIGLSGAIVKSGAGSVSLESLPKGVYVAKAQAGGNVYIQKFIK